MNSLLKRSALLLALPIAPLASAQEDVREIEEMVVEGQQAGRSRMAVELAEYGNQVQIVTSEEITRGGYTNSAEIIQQTVRGAHVRYSPDEGEFKIHLDGGGNRDTLVLQDGVPLRDRGPALETIWGATIIDPHLIERIEVFRGGQSLYFGSNSGVGVINIITKRPEGDRGGEFGVRYGAFNSREAWGNVRGTLDGRGRHGFMFYGAYKHTDSYDMFEASAYPDNQKEAGAQHDLPLVRNNVGAKYFWNIDDTSELRLHAQYSQINFRDAFPHATVFAPNYTKYPIFDADYVKQWSDQLLTEVKAWYRAPELDNTEMFPTIDPETGLWDGTYTPYDNKGFGKNQVTGGFIEYGVNTQTTYEFRQGTSVLFGLQNTNYRDDSDEEIQIEDDVFRVTGLYVDFRPRLPFSPSTRVSLAGRMDTSSSFDSRFDYKFGLRQPIGERFYLRANGGTSYSLPRTNELFVESENTVGNPDLEAEETTALAVGLGFDGFVGGMPFEGDVGVFATDIDNRISSELGAAPDGIRRSYINDDETTEIRGADVGFTLNLTPQLSVTANATYQDAQNQSEDRQVQATPEWLANMSVTYRSSDNRFHAALLPRWMGPQPYYVAGTPDVDYGEYMVVNGTLGYWLGPDREHRFQLRFVNLLDEDYAERFTGGDNRFASDREEVGLVRYQYGFQGKGRSAYFTYRYEF